MAANKQHAFALLALLLALLILVSGCTSSKYNPCCIKSGLYDETGAQLSSPKCYFPNETLFGDCTLDVGVSGAANCTDHSSCASITGEEACSQTASCAWNESQSQKCTGAQASWLLAVCQDLVPKSCVNNKCTAMVCGYSSIRPSPPPASQDWDANKSAQDFQADQRTLSNAMPPNDMILPAVNLQGATCDFNSMNKKLYNKITSSRGGLWVNSFRFGVGSSFSDYETARNYFPATDRVCAANPYAKTDRFSVYLNSANTFCQPSQSYYACNKLSGVNFKDERTCKLYCGGGADPYICSLISDPEQKRYICNADGFAYASNDTCMQKCGIISDANACTNNESQFPFLNTDSSLQARYRLKYVSDYVVDTPDPTQSSLACRGYGQPQGDAGFNQWTVFDGDMNPIACNDYTSWGDGPWFWTYSCYAAAGCTIGQPCPACNGVNKLGELRTYFDNHAYSSVDFDYEYYVKNLFAQYQDSPDAKGKLQFECESGSECISGSCDTTYYKRPMCENISGGSSMACGCSKAQFDDTKVSYPSCNLNSPLAMPAYSDTGMQDPDAGSGRPIVSDPINNYGPLFYPSQSVHLQNGSATSSFKYYFPAPDGASSPKPALFGTCGVAPAQAAPKKMCILYDRYCVDVGFEEPRIRITPEKMIWPAGSDGICHYTMEGEPCDINGDNGGPGKDYWEYIFNLNSANQADTVNSAHFGTCKMNGELMGNSQTNATAPYLATRDLGWCAPCTYATLAVQKVDFGPATNPGGVGAPRPLSCYEYRGQFNYVPDAQTYPYGGLVGADPDPAGLYDGLARFGTSSTEPVRKKSNPSAYEQDNDGNILQGGNYDNHFNYYCQDQWHGSGGWWPTAELPAPSAPYLKEKLTSYLQSNVMPILDEQSSKTSPAASAGCVFEAVGGNTYRCTSPNWLYTNSITCSAHCGGACTWEGGVGESWYCREDGKVYLGETFGSDDAAGVACNAACLASATKTYAPLSVCNDMGGDGAVVHVIGNSSMLEAAAGGFGSVLPASLGYDTRRYIGLSEAPGSTPSSLGGSAAIDVRASFLKQECNTPPLTGIEIMPGENATTLIGTGDLTSKDNPDRGKLHKFFYSATEPGDFAYRTANGIPDKVPGSVDMLLLDWYPMCSGTGVFPGDNEQYEFDSKLEFARAIMANFSKPMLVWKFAFPQNTWCNTTYFLDYMFNNTAAMVDSGMIGVIYSDWMMQDGQGYGPSSRQYTDTASYGADAHNWQGPISTGLTTQAPPTVRGSSALTMTLDSPRSMSDSTPGKGALFCALQLFSKRAIGYIPLAYGQKLYAENQTCVCQACSDFDYITGACDALAKASTDPMLPQIYCNDGAVCAMPSGRSDTGSFRCADRCMNATACKLCTGPANVGLSSFCRMTPVGGSTFGTSRCYNSITDDYWEFLAGLSPSEKCCLQGNTTDLSDAKYTYTMMTGTKQQSEFLQFPSHGEQNIDCGRSPDTSVLEYCNIRVPISQKEIACMQIHTPLCSTSPETQMYIE